MPKPGRIRELLKKLSPKRAIRAYRIHKISRTRTPESIYNALTALDKSREALSAKGMSSAHLDGLEHIYTEALSKQGRMRPAELVRASVREISKRYEREIAPPKKRKPGLKKEGRDEIKKKE